MAVEQIKKVKFMEGVSAQAKMKALSTEWAVKGFQ